MKKEFEETKRNFKMSWKFLKKYKKKMLIALFLSLILSGISIIGPILSAKLLLNLSGGLYQELIHVAEFLFIVEISRNIISYLFNRISDHYFIDMVTDVQMEMLKETTKIQTKEIDKNTSGLFIDRMNNDTNDIINIFTNIGQVVLDFLANIGVLVAVLIVSPYMFIYFLLTSLIIALIQSKRRKMYFEQNKKLRKLYEKRTGLISEIVRGMKDIKLLNAEEGLLKKTKERLNKVNKERLKMYKIGYKYSFLSGSIRDFFDVVFFILGTFLVSIKKLTAPNFLVIYMYKGRIENLLNFYNQLAEAIKSYNLSASRVFEVLGDAFEKEEEGMKQVIHLKGNISFQNVSFAYQEDLVLENVSFEIKPGERVGFVGTSGSGKSTIFNLLTRLYKVEDGQILMDGIDMNEINKSSLRKNIALIPQNPYIFNFSIKENLLLGNPKATDKELINVLEKAELMDRINELEKGLDTEVGEGGVTLSGGERQRLAIARSLLKGANIILFDEATSALDNITQDRIQTAIYGLDRSKTILIIAHRLSTVRNCDKIVVVDNGKILDIAPHQELLKRCKKYQELYNFEEVEKVR